MPAAIPAVISAVSAYAAGTTILGLSVLASSVLIGVGSFALNTLGGALTGKPKKQGSDLSALANQSQTQQVKQPITPRRFIYGECRVSGPFNYFGSTENNKYLHYVLVLATHEVDAITTVWFNEDPIFESDLDASGNVVSGKYANKARIVKHLGADDQLVDPNLLAEFPEITSNFRGRGCAYITVRFEKDTNVYASGSPNVSAWVRGKKVYDPRTAATVWNPNPALCLRDYLTNTRYGYSLASTKVNDTHVIAAANANEEMVPTLAVDCNVGSVNIALETLSLNVAVLPFQTGDRVTVFSNGSIPSGISALTNYYVIVVSNVGDTNCTIKLASSYANALAGTAINITSTGSGNIVVRKNAEPRYTCNGTLQTDMTPADILKSITSSMAGDIVPVGGKWIMKSGVYVAPTITLTHGDLRGPMEVNPKHSRRERFNQVQGLYISPFNFGEATDYPLVKDATYLTEDNNQPAIAQFDLRLTSRAQTAQRIARIQLNRHRRQKTIQITTSMKGMQLQATDTFTLSHPNHSLGDGVFEIAEWDLVPREVNGNTALTVDIIAHKTDSAIYDFDETVQEILPSAPLSAPIADPSHVGAPGAPIVTEEKYITADGNGVKVRGNVAFSLSVDRFVREYVVEYKLLTDADYIQLPRNNTGATIIYDIAPGEYTIRVKAISIFSSAESAWVENAFTIIGLQDKPGDVEEFSVISASDDAKLSWRQTEDLDVKVAGRVRIRHTTNTGDPDWVNARDITEALPGIATSAIVPLLDGVYMAKFVDSVGNESVNAAMIYTANTQLINMNAIATLTEHTSFAGTKTNMVAIDSVLRLDGSGLFDSMAGNFDDAMGNFDQGNGAGQVLTGSYVFASKVDAGKVARCYVKSHIKLLVYNAADLFDSREGLFDDAAGFFDGEDITGITVKMYIRTTNDDPNGTPTWTDWMPFVAGYFTARGYDFKLVVESVDSSYQADIQELTASVDVPDVVDGGQAALGAGALTTITYSKTFVDTPTPVAVINDAQAGDQLVIPQANLTSSNFKAGVLNSGSYVARNISWFARHW